MFANTANGANPRAILYSLIETAKANGLTPFDDIKHLLDELSRSYRGAIDELSRNPESIAHLLPWNVDLT